MKVIPRHSPLVINTQSVDEARETSVVKHGDMRYYPREDHALTDLVDEDEWLDADSGVYEDGDDFELEDIDSRAGTISTTAANINTTGYTELPTAGDALARVCGGGKISPARTPTHALDAKPAVDERLMQILLSSKIYA